MVQGGYRAEQSATPACLQRPLVPRSRFRQQVSAGVMQSMNWISNARGF
jgi:hypothetical protein